jgi:DEAD/DEAH box helicase domain-containing protein
LEAFLQGQDVCLATPTASGKSLVFMAAAIHLAHRDPAARILALYPSKALIQDQLDKWKQALVPHGLAVAFIDGSVATGARAAMLAQHRIILMTPDVLHAWLLPHADEKAIGQFLECLRLLILDEAHVYDGVFGTNMTYLLHRLQALSPVGRIIASTATIGEPGKVMGRLTGRPFFVLDAADDGTDRPERGLAILRGDTQEDAQAAVPLLHALQQLPGTRFLAFGDSRKKVERIVSRLHSHARQENEHEAADLEPRIPTEAQVLPYRAGYEEEDRRAIQTALSQGTLAGVVSTSALELGLDIGDLQIVILLGVPASMRSFWQRIGRVGRRQRGLCLIFDNQGLTDETRGGLAGFLARPVEPSWLYLENRNLQFTQALFTAQELANGLHGGTGEAAFADLPETFRTFVRDLLDEMTALPEDLFALKQRGGDTPHLVFPLRTGLEPTLKVLEQQGKTVSPLGELTHSQYLREAYPGAIYHYMGRTYRVFQVRWNHREIKVRRVRQGLTNPLQQTRVFPKFTNGLLGLWGAESSFLAETELQISDRVIGFTERKGDRQVPHLYGPGSNYSRKPITRYFETTGVCWTVPSQAPESLALTGPAIWEAFCRRFGIAPRDVSHAPFQANQGPLGRGPCQGWCIYDTAMGSLRLTQQLAEHFREVVEDALADVRIQAEQISPTAEGSSTFRAHVEAMESLLEVCGTWNHQDANMASTTEGAGEGWLEVFVPGTQVLRVDPTGDAQEVMVSRYRWAPKNGLVYDLATEPPGTVTAAQIRAIPDESRMQRWNPDTGATAAIIPDRL